MANRSVRGAVHPAVYWVTIGKEPGVLAVYNRCRAKLPSFTSSIEHMVRALNQFVEEHKEC